jgi:hypothetical protein
MNNGPDYSIQRTTGAGEISGQRMVTHKNEDRPRGSGRRKGRRRHAEADETDGVKVDLSQDDPADLSDSSDPVDLSDRSDDDSQDSRSVDCLA